MVEGAQTSDRSNVTSKPCPFGDLQAPGPSAAQCQQMDLRWPPLGHCGFTIPQQLHKYSQSRITILFCTHREAGVEAGYEASPALTKDLWAAPSGWALPVYRRISTQFYLPVAQLLGVQGTQRISIHFRTQSRSSHSVFKLSASLLCHFVKSSPHLRQSTHHLHGTDHTVSTHNLTVHLGLA